MAKSLTEQLQAIERLLRQGRAGMAQAARKFTQDRHKTSPIIAKLVEPRSATISQCRQ